MNSKVVNIISLSLLLLSLLLLAMNYSNNSPFKAVRTLPEIEINQVSRVSVEYFIDETYESCYEGDLNELILWFNNAKELKTDMGTTSDCRMTISLEGDKEIYIWNLSSYEWVTIGYRDGDAYYQTNAHSEELAGYFMSLRGRMPNEISLK